MIIFVHGVPDTAHLWEPLRKALGLWDADEDSKWMAPTLPGFGTSVPRGFSCTKDDYAFWLIEIMERADEPVHLVGHDWGALLVQRAACLRPERVRSWCLTNALIDPDYRGHSGARLWAKPIVGELAMLLWRNQSKLAERLIEAGMPETLVELELSYINKRMRQSILKLYRSANGLQFGPDWTDPLTELPQHGQLFWGEDDPFVDVSYARSSAERLGIPLHIEKDIGHWACHARAEEFADVLKQLWARAEA